MRNVLHKGLILAKICYPLRRSCSGIKPNNKYNLGASFVIKGLVFATFFAFHTFFLLVFLMIATLQQLVATLELH